MATAATIDAAWVGDPPIRLTRYVRQSPEPPQHAFLFIDHIREALYGGAAGGGKSSALLAAALQYVDVPGYAALLLRRTFRDLDQPDALIPRSKEWLAGTDAHYNDNDHRWTFPSGATLTFGYLAHEDDKLQYQGAAFQFVGFDELTQFSETQYTYLFSRCRRPKDIDGGNPLAQVPLRVRSASNPGGPGHDWVRARFGLHREDGDPLSAPYVCHRDEWPHTARVFIPAKLEDNPHLDADSYLDNLAELDHHTRAQLRDGDWDSRPPGDLFRKEWFPIVDLIPEGCRWVRRWDLAATEPSDANPDPDWTVGARAGRHPNGSYFVEHVERLRARPEGVLDAIVRMAQRDGHATVIWLPQDPGQAGKSQVDAIIRDHRLQGFTIKAERETGSKFMRAQPVSSKAERGLIHLKRGVWNTVFLDEHEAFTETGEHAHDDQVDALSGAMSALATSGGAQTQSRLQAHAEPVTTRGNLVLTGEQFIDKT